MNHIRRHVFLVIMPFLTTVIFGYGVLTWQFWFFVFCVFISHEITCEQKINDITDRIIKE